MLIPPTTNFYTVDFGRDPANGQGFIVHQGGGFASHPILLRREDFGDAITYDIRAISDTATQNVSVLEVVEV